MPARAMWKAELCLADVRVPVKLYAAVQDTKIHFRLLHAEDLAPVQQQMVDPERGEPVPKEALRRGIEVEKNVFVLLTDEEREAVEPESSRAIRVEQVVEPAQVDERWFDRPYYLGPDGDATEYFALAQALEKQGRLGIARWVMRKKRYVGALHGSDGYLMLETLRHDQEMVRVEPVAPPSHRAPDARELALAEQLVGTLEDRFEPAEYRDEHREQVMALIKAKAGGKTVRFPKEKARERAGSLTEDLEASLRSGREAAGGR